MCHHWGCISINWPLSHPFRSLVATVQKINYLSFQNALTLGLIEITYTLYFSMLLLDVLTVLKSLYAHI